jgi:hypothetical protein
MTNVLAPKIGEIRDHDLCDRCEKRYGQHWGYNCDHPSIDGNVFSKFQEKESKMKYDKETVVGVLELVFKESWNWHYAEIILEELIRRARLGNYSTPTLEEVWKEKIENAKSRIDRFVFKYGENLYFTERENPKTFTTPECQWLAPRRVEQI